MIRKNLLGASAAALLLSMSSNAFAADLPYVAPYDTVAPAGYYDWTGFYIGAQIGYMWLGANGGSDDNVVGGLHVGYNYQVNNWVLGIEGDLELSAFDDNSWLGSVRARLGYAFDRVLIYTTAGAAFTHFNIKAPPIGSDSNTHVGWTAGIGAEYAITNHVTARVEYRYADFGAKNYNFGGVVNRLDLDKSHTVRVGVSYKF